MPSYCNQADLLAYVEGLTISDPAQMDRIINRAEADLDSILPGVSTRSPVGLSAPAAPVVALGAAGALNGLYVYACTFVTPQGETNFSLRSSQINPANQRVVVTPPIGVPGSAAPGDAVIARRVYRCKVGDVNGPLLLVGSIPDNATTTLTDNVLDSALGVQAPEVNSTVGRKVDVTTLTPAQEQGLARAACAQTEYRLEMGERFFVRAQRKTTQGPDFSTTGKLPYIGPKTRRELAQLGLVATGTRATPGPGARVGAGFFSPGTLPWPYPFTGGISF